MAARNVTIPCQKGEPTLISDGAVTNARVIGTKAFTLLATLTSTPPADAEGGVPMLPYSILAADLDIADLFPGVGSSLYLWAWPGTGDVEVSVSHA